MIDRTYLNLRLQPGETYAIQPDNQQVHHAGKFVGTVDIDEVGTWLAFDTGTREEPRMRFYNPDRIRSLLPEKRPEP